MRKDRAKKDTRQRGFYRGLTKNETMKNEKEYIPPNNPIPFSVSAHLHRMLQKRALADNHVLLALPATGVRLPASHNRQMLGWMP